MMACLFDTLMGSHVVKEAITQVARKLKEDEVRDHSFTQLLDNYPKDLSEDDLRLGSQSYGDRL